MSVYLRGKKFHYRFQIEGEKYSGSCPVTLSCAPSGKEIAAAKKEAEKFEKAEKERVVQFLCNLKEKEREIRQNKSVVALIENYKMELTGGRQIRLDEAYPLAAAKPAKRQSKSSYANLRKVYWGDFTEYMKATYPDITTLSAVRRCHCESYVSYLAANGRFVKEVKASITVGKRRKKTKEISYTRDFLISPKTIKEIVGCCRWVFSRLQEDAGIVGDPWRDVILPARDQVDREVFTYDELQLIWENLHPDDFVYPLFLVAANSGMTEGDICTLEWSEIDWLANFIRRDRRKTGVDIELPIMPQLAEYLATLPRTGKYIFPEHAEIYLDVKQRSKVSARVIRFLQSIGIKTTRSIPGRRDVSVKDLHSMRHVFAYRAKKAGIPTSVIKKMLGHAHESMTEKYADHDTVEDLNREIKKLSSPFGQQEHVCDLRRQIAEAVYRLPEDTLTQIAGLIRAAAAPEFCRHLLA
jgi:integrase